jgi:hypothetical protein
LAISEATDKRPKAGKALLIAGGICWALPVVLLALSLVIGTLGGWAGVLAMADLPVGTVLFLIGFVLLVVRGKAGVAYKDRQGNF